MESVCGSAFGPKTLESTLWEMGTDHTLRQLLTYWEKGRQVCCGIWTAEGRYFLFLSGGQYWYVAEPLVLGVRPVMLNFSGLSITAAATNPLGKEIFISATAPKAAVYAWDLKSNGATLLYPEARAQRLEYSSDQRYVAYKRREGPVFELWLMHPDGSDRHQIVAAPATVQMARFSPDGKKLAFMAACVRKSRGGSTGAMSKAEPGTRYRNRL